MNKNIYRISYYLNKYVSYDNRKNAIITPASLFKIGTTQVPINSYSTVRTRHDTTN